MRFIFFFSFLFLGNIVFSQTEGNVYIDSSSEIKELINKRITYNKANPKINGYRIQIYYGSENGAISARNKFLGLFPDSAVYVVYESPDWKVKVGNFKTKLEADKAREEILLSFDGAFVLEEKIPLR